MSRCRRVLAWLLLLLLPLQAMSAVSMRACATSVSVRASVDGDALDHSASSVNVSGAVQGSGHSNSRVLGPAAMPDSGALTDRHCGVSGSACCLVPAIANVQSTESIQASDDAPQTVLTHLRTRAEAPPKKPPRL